jgi:hypothetical protein
MSTATVTYSVMTRRVRAYFAPVDRVQGRPAIFDPSVAGGFDLDAPPAPWVDLGWIEGFSRKSTSTLGVVTSGSPAVTQAQTRGCLDARVTLRFKTWNKLTMGLAAGSEHMNLLLSAGPAAGGSGAKAVTAVSLNAWATSTFLPMAAASAAQFSASDLVAVDVDYAGQTGYVGSGVHAAYVQNALAVNSDPDYVRRVTWNVALVGAVSTAGLSLAAPLVAGAPTVGMKVQALTGFVDREGGRFFAEWSGLFVVEGEQGERICYFYPRLQPAAGAEETAESLAGTLERILLSASFRALPVMDGNDGQQVVCYRSFLPSIGVSGASA